jgi:hypothetical protein
MEKKKVRIYKSEDGNGKFVNKTAKFLQKAQMGAEAQSGNDAALDQYFDYAYQMLKRNAKPEVIFTDFMRAGLPQDVTYSILTEVIKQMVNRGELDPDYMEEAQPQAQQQEENVPAQQEVLASEDQEREAKEAEQQELAQSDEGYYDEEEEYAGNDEYLGGYQEGGYTDTIVGQYDDQNAEAPEPMNLDALIRKTPGIQEGMVFPGIESYIPNYSSVSWDPMQALSPDLEQQKRGGSAKKKFVKNIMAQYKKEEGGESGAHGKGKRTDTLTNDVERMKTGFLKSLSNEATKAATEKMYDQMMQSGDPKLMQIAMSPTDQNQPEQMMQSGGEADWYTGEIPSMMYSDDLGGLDNEMLLELASQYLGAGYTEEDLFSMLAGSSSLPSELQADQAEHINNLRYLLESQMGGFVSSENPLQRFVAGGDENMMEYNEMDMPMAQSGKEVDSNSPQVRRATINYVPRKVTTSGGLFRTLAPWNPAFRRSSRIVPITMYPGSTQSNLPMYRSYTGELVKPGASSAAAAAKKTDDNKKYGIAPEVWKTLNPSHKSAIKKGYRQLGRQLSEFEPIPKSDKKLPEKEYVPVSPLTPEQREEYLKNVTLPFRSEFLTDPYTGPLNPDEFPNQEYQFGGGAQCPPGYYKNPSSGLCENFAGQVAPSTQASTASSTFQTNAQATRNQNPMQATGTNAVTGEDYMYSNDGALAKNNMDQLTDFKNLNKSQPQQPIQGFGKMNTMSFDPEAGLNTFNAAARGALNFYEKAQNRGRENTMLRETTSLENFTPIQSDKHKGDYVDYGSMLGQYRFADQGQERSGFSSYGQSGGSIKARTGYQVQGALVNDVPAMGGKDYNAYIGKPKLALSKYITAVPREEANLEAEGGETVYGDINGDGMAEHKTIKGPRHAQGGVPLNLPDDTFIFSDFRGMNIKNPNVLKMFGKSTGSHTPASLAKQYDVDKYRKILQDPNSDILDRKTAELMIKNYTMKLGALALAQEAKKGFPQGIPVVAKPYMEAHGLSVEDFIPQEISKTVESLEGQALNEEGNELETMQSEDQQAQFQQAQDLNEGQPIAAPMPQEAPMAMYGMTMGGYDMPFAQEGGIPEAAYGMPMGGNSQNWQGREGRIPASQGLFRRGGYLPKAQTGNTNPKPTVIDAINMTDAQLRQAIWNAQQDNPKAEIQVKRKGEDGKSYTQRVKGSSFSYPTGESLTENDLQGFPSTPKGKAVAAQYLLIKKNLENPKVKSEIIKNTIDAVNDPNAWKGKNQKSADPNRTWNKIYGDNPTEEQVLNAALALQKRNLMFEAHDIDAQLFSDVGNALDTPDKILQEGYVNPKTGKPYTKQEAEKELENLKSKGFTSIGAMSEKLNVPLDSKGKDRLLQQATMHGYAKTYQNFSKGDYKNDKEAQYALDEFLGSVPLVHSGAGDEKSIGSLYGPIGNKISPLDDKYDIPVVGGKSEYYNVDKKSGRLKPGRFTTYGDTTAGEKIIAKERQYEYEDLPAENSEEVKELAKKCPCQLSNGTETDTGIDPNTGECNPCSEDVPYDVEEPAPWWLQDTIKTTGAFGDLMSIEKYTPWAPGVDLETPRPTFLDPTRELAANTEQQNIQATALAQFAGPQGTRLSGQGAGDIANILSKYNNANVNLGNQFEFKSNDIRNQERMLRQGTAQRLYDQNTIANQQYDNARMAMKNQLRNYYTNAITNRWKTDALNQMFPNYAVSADVGGKMNFTGPSRGFKPQSSQGQGYFSIREQCKEELGAGATNAELEACAKNASNTTASGGLDNEYQERVNAVNTMYGNQMGKGQKGGATGGFIYADIVTPFIL